MVDIDDSPRNANTEKLFEALVPKFRGGRIVRELIPDTPDMRPNADYYFPNDNVIAELKCLEVELDSAERLHDRLVSACKQLGYSPLETLQIAVRQKPLPQDVARRVIDKSLSHVRKAVDKANRQIGATKEQLNKLDTLGILIVANDNNPFMTPFEQFKLLFRHLRDLHNSHIDGLIYVTPNYYYRVEGSMDAASLWLPAYKKPIPTLIEFVDDLGTAWSAHRLAQDSALSFAMRRHEPRPEMFDIYPERRNSDS
jgi:hypothetical protein